MSRYFCWYGLFGGLSFFLFLRYVFLYASIYDFRVKHSYSLEAEQHYLARATELIDRYTQADATLFDQAPPPSSTTSLREYRKRGKSFDFLITQRMQHDRNPLYRLVGFSFFSLSLSLSFTNVLTLFICQL